MSKTPFTARPAPAHDDSLPALLPFTKMQGAGNDYIYVEEFEKSIARPAPLAVAISDRHFGVGGDGLVLMGRSSKADFRMRMFNADGSEAEMCGNAVRCVGKYLHDKGITRKTSLTLETLGGIRTLELRLEGGLVASVRVDMGAPRLAPDAIPLAAEGEDFINRTVVVDGVEYKGTALSMGNPHLVVPVPEPESLDLPRLGPLFEHLSIFPRRVNTEFVRVLAPDRIRMRVWERGAGETLACGTGACAALVACALNGWTGRRAVVELRGGELDIEWTEDNLVFMSGPAAFVFSGNYVMGS